MEDLIFVAVVGARFLIPLLIPRFPLPAIVAALVIDAADQTIFAALDAEPANYQGYDKALDVFYLTIAYISTIRNWTGGLAFRVSQFLWYYRLAGVVAFELSGARALLIIFPNTFEYFFIFYELVRLWYDPSRLSRKQVVGAAAGIWVFIKLPQEWWIHIAKLDVTDVLSDNAWLYPALGVVIAAAVAAGWAQRSKIPAGDWPCSFDVDRYPTTVLGGPADPPTGARALINHPLTEKTLLVGLVSVIFSQILPGVDTSSVQLIVGLGIIIALNSVVSQWLIGRGTAWASTAQQFIAMAIVNTGIMFGFRIFLNRAGRDIVVGNTLFFLALLTLIVTLYDRFRALRLPDSKHAAMIARPAPNGMAAPAADPISRRDR